MATRRIVSPRSAFGTPLRAILSRPYSSSSSSSSSSAYHAVLPLAYDHHEPPKDGRHRQDSPIIFMHGLFGSKKNNRSVSRVLARDLKRHVYTVVSPPPPYLRLSISISIPSAQPPSNDRPSQDLRNHGESPHAVRHDYLAMADDVAGFIRDHGLQEPTLIGHSMGAKTAMTLSLAQPSLIASIVAVDNAPIDAALGGPFARYIRGMREIDDAGVARASDADAILQPYEDSLPIRQFLLGNLHRPSAPSSPSNPQCTSPSASTSGSDAHTQHNKLKFRVPLDVLARSLDHLGDFPFKDPGAARFEGPALFVRGTHSTYVPDEVVPLIGQFFPRFELVDVEAGHWLISEKPEEFLRAVIEFLTPKE
ncbi:alpha/beta-hydrolase [Hypoxylon sp. NC1633]|nr:alpha/beta-hydrolase [Hypoxylon sp. NC1633]